MIRLLPAAEGDLREVYGWYDSQLPGLGETFVRAIDALLFRVERAPRARQLMPGIAGRRGVRRARLRGFPWLVLYAVIESEIIVLALVHAARRPRYFRHVARRVLDA